MFVDVFPRLLWIFASADREGDARSAQDRSARPDELTVDPSAASVRMRALIDGIPQEQLLDRVRAGDVDAFATIYRAYFERLWKFAYTLIHSRDVAQEVVHDLFLTIWESRATLDVRDNLSVYLHTAVRNRVYKLARHDRVVERFETAATQTDTPPLMGSTITSPDLEFDTSEIERTVHAVIDLASARDRQVLSMRWDEGLSYDEIARALGLSKSGVRVIVQRWQERLRPLFERFR